MKRFIRMHHSDCVATSLSDITSGETIPIFDKTNAKVGEITALQHIPFGNKIALTDISCDATITKYSHSIGIATQNIPKGHLVHIHNVRSLSVDIPPLFKEEIMHRMNIVNEGNVI